MFKSTRSCHYSCCLSFWSMYCMPVTCTPAFHAAELPQAHRTSISGMNPNCLYAGPGDWARVAVARQGCYNRYIFNVFMLMSPRPFNILWNLAILGTDLLSWCFKISERFIIYLWRYQTKMFFRIDPSLHILPSYGTLPQTNETV